MLLLKIKFYYFNIFFIKKHLKITTIIVQTLLYQSRIPII